MSLMQRLRKDRRARVYDLGRACLVRFRLFQENRLTQIETAQSPHSRHAGWFVLVALLAACGEGRLRVTPAADAAPALPDTRYVAADARDVPTDPLVIFLPDAPPDGTFFDLAVKLIPDVGALDAPVASGADAESAVDVVGGEGGASPQDSGVQCGDAACGDDWYCFIWKGTGDPGRCVLAAACASGDLCDCFCYSPPSMCQIFGGTIYCMPFE
jgi:hypothetical protein